MYATAADLKLKVSKSLSQLPPFSPVLNKLLANLADDDARVSELCELIERDAVLAGNVLRVVNSAAYVRHGEIHSISRAVSVLGLNKLRNMLLGLSISRMWSGVKMPHGWPHARFNLHSVGAALLADHMAQQLPANNPESAFVAGLLHDFGKLLIAAAMPSEYAKIHELYMSGGRTMSECETEILGADHAAISAIALTQWNLPQPIRVAVRDHHRIHATGTDIPLSRLIQVADATVNRAGHSLMPMTSDNVPEQDLLDLAGTAAGARIFAGFRTEFECIRQLF